MYKGEEFNTWLSSTPYTGPVGVIVKLYVKQVLKEINSFCQSKAHTFYLIF